MHDEILLEDENVITKEERESIRQEMEHVLAKVKDVVSEDTLRVKGAKKSSTPLILYLNIFSVLFLLLIGGVAYIYYAVTDNSTATEQESVNVAENVVVRLILKEAQDAIQQKQSEINDFNNRLQQQYQQRTLAQKGLEQGLDKYKASLQNSFQQRMDALRAKLEASNVSNAKVQQQMQKQTEELKKQQKQQLEQYKKEQQYLLEQANKNISVLQNQIDAKQHDVNDLQQSLTDEKNELKAQVKYQQEQASAEIAEANQRILQLQQRQKQREQELFILNASYQRALIALGSGQYDSAESLINQTVQMISTSEYKNNSEVKRMASSLGTMKSILSDIKVLQITVDNALGNNTSIAGYKKELELSQEQQAQLESALEKERNTAVALQQQIDSLNNEIRETRQTGLHTATALERRYKTLETQYQRLQQDGQKNMQIIINYLWLKKQNKDTSQIKPLVNQLVEDDKYYSVIGAVLAKSLDSSGQLRF